MLQPSEFSSKILAICYWVCCQSCLVWSWSLNHVLSNFISTSDEIKEQMEEACCGRVLIKCIKILLCLAFIFLWLPFALVAFLLKIGLQKYRCRYAYHYKQNQHEKNPYGYFGIEEGNKIPFFHVSSFNTCLLPEALSRINNLRNVEKRAKVISAYIVNSQVRPNPRIVVQSPTATDLKILSVCSMNDQLNSSSLPRNQSQRTSSGDDIFDDVFVAQVSYPSCSRIQRDRILSDSATLVKSRYGNDGSTEPGQGYSLLSRINEGLSFSSVDMRNNSTSGVYRESNNRRSSINHQSVIIEYNRPPKPLPSSTSASVFFDSNPSVYLRDCGVTVSEPVSTIPSTSPVLFSFDASHLRDFSHEIITDFEHSLSMNFPPEMDFLCLQEVFDTRASKHLVRGLQVWFSHILTDAGVCSWSANKFMLSSGLVIASRYPIIDAEFKHFTAKEKEDKAICKGLLMAKVHVGTTKDGQKLVGYISTTQLQSTQDHETRSIQMTEIVSWLESFRSTAVTENELIVLDVLTGNFNFDNMSPKDVSDFNHPLFSIYQDPCRQSPGLDHSWTVGTVLKSSTLHDKEVSTPEGLQRILEDVQLRGKYVEDLEVYFTSASGSLPSNLKDYQRYKGNGRRRVDLILYNNDNAHYQQMCEEFHFVTQLTSLTDHIPLSMVVSSGTQRPTTWSQQDGDTSKEENVFYDSSIDLDVVSDAGSSHDSWT
ncbi:sphingomyelin phosphodiesterase 5-like [Anneissia japonica]|uniref:sphingomyelin phosphodiesterase 5-like n=1 Tax=Anneissia japonica TaxID=1529436 RepID=UPI0014257D6C|nr:sphingomyelin phosphodiesterase 5-like [Anneissia japonica]